MGRCQSVGGRERYMWRRGLLGPFYVSVRSWMFCWRIGDALGRSKHAEKDEISIADNTPVRTMLSVLTRSINCMDLIE